MASEISAKIVCTTDFEQYQTKVKIRGVVSLDISKDPHLYAPLVSQYREHASSHAKETRLASRKHRRRQRGTIAFYCDRPVRYAHTRRQTDLRGSSSNWFFSALRFLAFVQTERERERSRKWKANSPRVVGRTHEFAPTDPVMNMHFPPLSMCRLRRDTVGGRSLLSLAATRHRVASRAANSYAHPDEITDTRQLQSPGVFATSGCARIRGGRSFENGKSQWRAAWSGNFDCDFISGEVRTWEILEKPMI